MAGERPAAGEKQRRAAAEKRHVELEHFHILLCGLRTHFNQTRGVCGMTNQDCVGEFYLV